MFQRYYDILGLPNLLQKTDYHALVPLVPIERIDPEIGAKLDRIAEVADRAHPVT